MDMVLHRDYVLRTTRGHSFEFKKGVVISVPKHCVADAVAIGAVRFDGADVDIIDETKQINLGPTDPAERKEALFAAYERIVNTNARDDFTAGGLPQLLAVTREVGFPVDGKERNVTWQAYRDAAGSENK